MFCKFYKIGVPRVFSLGCLILYYNLPEQSDTLKISIESGSYTKMYNNFNARLSALIRYYEVFSQ